MPPERRPELLLVDIIERAEATLSAVRDVLLTILRSEFPLVAEAVAQHATEDD